MKRLIVFLLINFLVISLFSQHKTLVIGKIIDAVSRQPLIGATIVLDSTKGAVSDTAGNFIIEAIPGKHSLNFNYIGYKSKRLAINLPSDDTIYFNIGLDTEIQLLDEIVVSAGKYEQKISDVIVSMDIIKPDRISETNTTSLESAINQSPGIDVLDGQPRIRGGSGYSYGAGSRVLVLVDDLPILSPDASDVKWEYLPVENISQIEIIK
jgi:hypothetical protein